MHLSLQEADDIRGLRLALIARTREGVDLEYLRQIHLLNAALQNILINSHYHETLRINRVRESNRDTPGGIRSAK
jgi:hypothetical protein